jgi:hypothetical protein
VFVVDGHPGGRTIRVDPERRRQRRSARGSRGSRGAIGGGRARALPCGGAGSSLRAERRAGLGSVLRSLRSSQLPRLVETRGAQTRARPGAFSSLGDHRTTPPSSPDVPRRGRASAASPRPRAGARSERLPSGSARRPRLRSNSACPAALAGRRSR